MNVDLQQINRRDCKGELINRIKTWRINLRHDFIHYKLEQFLLIKRHEIGDRLLTSVDEWQVCFQEQK